MYKYSKLLIKELISRATNFSNKRISQKQDDLAKNTYYFCKVLLGAQPVLGTKALYKVPNIGQILTKI